MLDCIPVFLQQSFLFLIFSSTTRRRRRSRDKRRETWRGRSVSLLVGGMAEKEVWQLRLPSGMPARKPAVALVAKRRSRWGATLAG